MNRHKTIAAVAIVAALAVALLAAPSQAQIEEQPINTRVKLLEHKVKNLEARIATLTTPEIGQCVRGPSHNTLNVHRAEGRSGDATRQLQLHVSYLLDCGPHGVTRQHLGALGTPTWCHDLDGMTEGSTDPVPAAWATWWATVSAAGVDDACTTVKADADTINANGTSLSRADKLLLRHTDPLVGWEAYHVDQHSALPSG